MVLDYITPKARIEKPINYAPVEAVSGMTRGEARTLIASIGALLILAAGMWFRH